LKIRIVGSYGSGKTFLAKYISEIYKDKRIIVKNKNSAKKYLFLDKAFLNV